jgi:orotate phosphoribosyltransferase
LSGRKQTAPDHRNILVEPEKPIAARLSGFAKNGRFDGAADKMISTQPADAVGDIVVARSDARWTRLREIVLERSLKIGDFVLSSQRTSKYLFQLRQTTMLPEGAALISDLIVEYMKRNGLRCIGGMEMGAVPIVAAVGVSSHAHSYPVDAFFVRKEAKKHGARERIDGYVTDGGEVLLIDDVATTGKSIFAALAGLKEEYPSCFARRALVVIDRQEGATEALAEQGISLVSIFKKSDFPIPS